MDEPNSSGRSPRRDLDSNNQLELQANEHITREVIQSHHGSDNDWFIQVMEMFGLPRSWSRNAPLTYTDSQLYLLNPSKKRSPKHRRCDLPLTANGVSPLLLKVQAVDSLKEEQNCTWRRNYIKDITTNTVRIAMLGSHLQAWFQHTYRATEWAIPVSWVCYAGMWMVSFSALILWFIWLCIRHGLRLLFSNRRLTPELDYLPFNCEDYRYARIASNPMENRRIENRVGQNRALERGRTGPYGLIRPRVLMQTQGDRSPKAVRNFPPNVQYLFIAFNFGHFPVGNIERANELVRVANKVTQHLGFNYFWVSISCMGITDQEAPTPERRKLVEESDIYSISDVIRGAERVAVILPDSIEGRCPKLKELVVDNTATNPPNGQSDTMRHLKEWGDRVWTFPEILLGPDQPIKVCWKDTSIVHWFELNKRDFPASVWEDSESSMQMIQHYRNTNLSRLEFIKVAMRCLMNRQQKGIQWHYPGDLSYVLMGFLRIRPPINKYDSSLQAFARLSLPADNDRLIERFVCLEPPSRHAHWATMVDRYNADLWSIEPMIQVSGVGENDTVIIEKAWGAKIELEHFTDISALNISRWRRLENAIAGLAIFPSVTARMSRHFRRRKFRAVYPRLFSFEGFMSITQIEEKLFGGATGFLTWSKNGSILSQHGPGEPVHEPRLALSGDENRTFAGLQPTPLGANGVDVDIEAQFGVVAREGGNIFSNRDSIEDIDGRIMTYPMIGRQPWRECNCAAMSQPQVECSCPDLTERKLERIGRSDMGEDKIFTLVDTVTMTVTLLTAAWPPQALIACGTEGGMERVLACSYDWTTGIFYRESVLRFPGKLLDHMHRLPKIRLGFRRSLTSADLAARRPRPQDQTYAR